MKQKLTEMLNKFIIFFHLLVLNVKIIRYHGCEAPEVVKDNPEQRIFLKILCL